MADKHMNTVPSRRRGVGGKQGHLRGLRTTVGAVSYPNESSNWNAGSDYEITWTWEGSSSEEYEYVQVSLYQNGKLYASLVPSTVNDGQVSARLDSSVPQSTQSQIQIALLPDKEATIMSDEFTIMELDISNTALFTSTGILIWIVALIGGIYLFLNSRKLYREWREHHQVKALFFTASMKHILLSPGGRRGISVKNIFGRKRTSETPDPTTKIVPNGNTVSVPHS
mmetsp:Transcript_52689/g.76961  ORF Transcript_52689/g.76961 Transcript_52689/m.76961 type:complete len:226 (+) Transcript_52689:133-810(+)